MSEQSEPNALAELGSKPLLASDFNDWWAKNHPLDWWASVPHRKGQPMNHGDRILVRALCQRAYEANAKGEVSE